MPKTVDEQDQPSRSTDKAHGAGNIMPADAISSGCISPGPAGGSSTPAVTSRSTTGEATASVPSLLRQTLQTEKLAGAAQIIIALAVTMAIFYFAKPVLVTILTSILIAFILEPLVRGLEYIKIPRAAGALLAVLLATALLYAATYFFYNRALSFVQELPTYSGKIRDTFAKVREEAKELEDAGRKINPAAADDKKVVTVKPSSSFIFQSMDTIEQLLAIFTFVPFIVYFMLTWEDYMREALVQLFEAKNRDAAVETMSNMAAMIRRFLMGNLIIGLFMSGAGIAVFWSLHLPYFYFVGIVSGFLSLIPYFGVLLAILPPLAAGLGHLQPSGFGIVVMTVLILHLFSMNVIYPKFLGKRLELNPLVITLSMLIWGWGWGAMGLILAMPITGALKIICDNVDRLNPVGRLMGESALQERRGERLGAASLSQH